MEQLSNEEYAAKFLRSDVAVRVRRLRFLVDRLEQEAEGNLKLAEQGKAPYARVPSSFMHEMAWGFANLDVASMVTTAADADLAHAKGE